MKIEYNGRKSDLVFDVEKTDDGYYVTVYDKSPGLDPAFYKLDSTYANDYYKQYKSHPSNHINATNSTNPTNPTSNTSNNLCNYPLYHI